MVFADYSTVCNLSPTACLYIKDICFRDFAETSLNFFQFFLIFAGDPWKIAEKYEIQDALAFIPTGRPGPRRAAEHRAPLPYN